MVTTFIFILLRDFQVFYSGNCYFILRKKHLNKTSNSGSSNVSERTERDPGALSWPEIGHAWQSKTQLLTMWWRRLLRSRSLKVLWKEAMLLSNLSECLPKNSLTSSMVFKEKESEDAEGSSEKEKEGQAGWILHGFLVGCLSHSLPCSPRVWGPIFLGRRR